LLLDCGADVNLLIPNIPYCNALIAACRLRKLRSIEVLVARGAKLNIGPSTDVYGKNNFSQLAWGLMQEGRRS
jgi:hypothetical protein